MELEKTYLIRKIFRINTKFGPSVIANFGDFKVNLPNRFRAWMDDKKITILNLSAGESKLGLKYIEKKFDKYNMIEFVNIK